MCAVDINPRNVTNKTDNKNNNNNNKKIDTEQKLLYRQDKTNE